MSVPPKLDPEKSCETCGTPLTRKRYNGRLEDRGVFLRRRHCSLTCANTRAEIGKSAQHWRARRLRLPTCEGCSTTTGLHVHHKDRNPANNAAENLQTLCGSCHLVLHWREDRPKRMAARRGASTGQRSTAGS